MKRDDLLWKGIIEDMPVHFLQFFFPESQTIFDFQKGFEFLDKELEELFPLTNPQHPRYVDKLIKAFTKNGKEEWILVHIEVQGYKDKDFSKRMFTYYYRLLDRYNKPVSALAIFTDDNPGYKPNIFSYQFLGTESMYKFNTYKIVEQDETSLALDPNPFALVVLTVLLAIKNKKNSDEGILSLKINLFRMLISRHLEKSTMRALINFLKMYVHFSKPETYLIFENEIKTITGNSTTMGIEELILQRAEQKGIEKGKSEVVTNLIVKMGLTDQQAADIAGVSVDFVKAIREKLNKKPL
jgi:predicted transposase/invertase (TIGR01784 family)